MEEVGLATIADLQRALSEQELAARFGKFGRRLASSPDGEERPPGTRPTAR